MKYGFIFAFIFFVSTVWGLDEVRIPTEQTYESGLKLCTEEYKAQLEHEKGFYVSVPVDYSKPEGEKTAIYVHFSGGFNPNKPTLFHFSGGPGQTSHWGLLGGERPFNVLLMDQRGIACSRPQTLKQYLNPHFYSSEAVARDAEEVRRFLKIPKLAVYGISYGTIPATMYASFFPQTTQSLILEGIVYSAEDQLWEAPHRRKLLQKMLDRLPMEIHTLMARISRDHALPDVWFSNLGRDEMLYHQGLRKLKAKLLELVDPVRLEEFIENRKDYYEPVPVEPHVLFISNQIPYYMIACQEMGLGKVGTSHEESLIDGKLVPKVDLVSSQTCLQLKAVPRKAYHAKNYPVQVPVTYFQGADDSATPAPHGVFHYKNVPKAQKQLLIMREGGHNPNLQLLGEDHPLQMQIFNHAVQGTRIPKSLIDQFNQEDADYFWAFTSK